MKAIIAILVCCFILTGCEADPVWKVEKTGTVERIEYLQGGISSQDRTIIHFADKSSIFLWDICEIPSEEIVVMKNQYGDRCVKPKK